MTPAAAALALFGQRKFGLVRLLFAAADGYLGSFCRLLYHARLRYHVYYPS